MENDNDLKPTIFDTLTQTREIQMLKTAIPYMNQAHKRDFAIFIKYMELQRAAQIFSSANANIAACEIPSDQNNRLNLLNELRNYATPKEMETIDALTNLISMISLYNV